MSDRVTLRAPEEASHVGSLPAVDTVNVSISIFVSVSVSAPSATAATGAAASQFVPTAIAATGFFAAATASAASATATDAVLLPVAPFALFTSVVITAAASISPTPTVAAAADTVVVGVAPHVVSLAYRHSCHVDELMLFHPPDDGNSVTR